MKLFICMLALVATCLANISELQKGKLLETIPKWGKQWRVSFSIHPIKKTAGWTNIIHFTADGNCCKNGQRIPAIYFISNTFRMHIRHSIDNNGNAGYDTKTDLPSCEASTVVLEQIRSVGKYIFKVIVNGKTVYTVHNTKPAEYNNVKVYASDPWYNPANALLKDFKYQHIPEFVMTCTSMSTPWNAEGGGKNIYLDRHQLQCPKGQALSQFHLKRDGKGKYHYEYHCCDFVDQCSSTQHKNTGTNADGNGNMVYLDRHGMDCGQNFISQFKLVRPTPKTIRYNYACCITATKKKCYDSATKWNNWGRGNTVYLDRHNVQCKANYLLAYARLQRQGTFLIRYAYKCCEQE